MKKSTGFYEGWRAIIFTLAVAFVSFVGAARADNDWRGHERGARQWHREHIHHRRYEPGPYVQEDPYVVYAPPMIVEPPSGINIVIPLHIR